MARLRSQAEDALRAQFGQFYAESHLAVNQRIEEAVCGCCYGGVSWATRDEIDLVARLLALGPGDQLMDLGAGSGWPGLYLAEASGCDVTLTDLPHEGLVVAARRARTDTLSGDIAGNVHLAVADGQALPSRDGAYDALTHSDVLCCLPAKREVLRECRRVLREDGQMIFSVIFVAPGLSADESARAIEAGPPYIEARAPYEDLLQEAGWRIAERFDRTPEYLDSIKAFFKASADNREDFIRANGEEEFAARMEREGDLVACLQERHICRVLYQVVPS